MDLASNKVILPPLGRNLKSDNILKSKTGTKTIQSRSSETNQFAPSLDNLQKTNEGSEAVGMPLPPLSQSEQPNTEDQKTDCLRKKLRQTIPTVETHPKRTLSKSEKDYEFIIKSKKRSSDYEASRGRKAIYKHETEHKLISFVPKSLALVKPEDTSEEENDKTQEIIDEVEMKTTQEVSQEPVKKKKRGITLLKDMVPLNLEAERKRFFELNFQYNPQFIYKLEDRNQKFNESHKAYLKVAEIILDKCIKEFEDDETYIELTGSKLSTEREIEEQYTKYVKELEIENYLNLVFTDKIVSSASCLYKGKGKGAILISLPIQHREKKVLSLFHHEIGTHYVRKFNERQQPWAWNRKQYNLSSCLVIEEGLAMLNQTLDDAFNPEGKPYLFSAALHYYACYKSSLMGFQELFKDLEKYIKDPMRRWKECIRVKRGISDTAKPGGMYKDQVYLRGAIEILQNRNKIDFLLLHFGKLNLKDLQRMIKSGLVKTDKMKVPSFLKDLDNYKAALDRIATFNSIDNLA